MADGTEVAPATSTTVKANKPAPQGTKVPPPPRLSDNSKVALSQLGRYVQDLFNEFDSGEILQRSNQSQTGTIDPDDLPDPATATVASAQQTANEALVAANEAKATAGAILGGGQVTISGVATSGSGNFPGNGTTDYFVTATRVSSSGSPPAASGTVVGITKAAGSVTIQVGTAPGGGNSVTFDFIVIANPGGS